MLRIIWIKYRPNDGNPIFKFCISAYQLPYTSTERMVSRSWGQSTTFFIFLNLKLTIFQSTFLGNVDHFSYSLRVDGLINQSINRY